MFEIKGKYSTATVYAEQIEESCIGQITNLVNHCAFTNPVAIMPDCHYGNGSTIGFTMEVTDKVIANVVGVDIGCGMLAANIGPDHYDLNLAELDQGIRTHVPFGFATHGTISGNNLGRVDPTLLQKVAGKMRANLKLDLPVPSYDNDWVTKKCEKIGMDLGKFYQSLGTLGGGNHFIEVGKSLQGNYWITIHSGSRQFGLKICNYWHKRAVQSSKWDKKQEFEDRLAALRDSTPKHKLQSAIQALREELGFHNQVQTKGLEWLEGDDRAGYLYDMLYAQEYAIQNRIIMMEIILMDVMGLSFNEAMATTQEIIHSVHNYVSPKDHIIRKGACSAHKGEKFVVPFNMRDGILICEGKGNPEWNYSAPHGAGRLMSRSKAKQTIKMDTFVEQMKGIHSSSVCKYTLDEAPDAYKDPAIIEAAIEPTGKIIDRIIPVLNLKATK